MKSLFKIIAKAVVNYLTATLILQLLQHVNLLKIQGRKHDFKIRENVLRLFLFFLVIGWLTSSVTPCSLGSDIIATIN